jgi:glutamate-1-semialdehyde 2,1-aminomutase
MIGFYFSDRPVKNYSDALGSDVRRFRTFFWAMLERGVSFAPSAFEAGFISVEHNEAIVDETLAAVRDVFRSEFGKE